MGFEDQIRAFRATVERKIQTIFRQSLRQLIDIAQLPEYAGGSLPTDTGLLRASMTVTTNGAIEAALAPMTRAEAIAYAAGRPAGDDTAVETAGIGDVVLIQWLAGHAALIEFGGAGKPGKHFVTFALANWPRIVSETAQRVAQER